MKSRLLLIIALVSTFPALACAKKPKTQPQETVQENKVEDFEPVITEECRQNVSLFHENVKHKQFTDAYDQWYEVLTTCPTVSRNIYIDGPKIIEYLYNNTNDENEKNRLRELLMKMHDIRIKYMGDDETYPTAYILGEKGMDYAQYYPESYTNAYDWLKASVVGLGNKSKITVLVDFAKVSYGVYRQDTEKYGEQFMADYQLVTNLLAEMAADPTNKNASAAAAQKEYVDGLFAQSGAADCGKLDELYAQTVEENRNNLEMLGKVMLLYKMVGCTESEVYFAAAEAANTLQPTKESAAGVARMYQKKEEWNRAIDYYKQAISLIVDDNDADRENYLYSIALIYMDKLNRYSDARQYARLSLEANPNQGRCYILIGMCYAASKPYSSSDMPAAKAAILNKTVFWAAVDKFVKAKQVDPSCAVSADKLIASYSKYFPTKEEMFDLPNEFGGSTFTVGGWIGETTSCRAAK